MPTSLAAQYDNRARVPEHEAIIAGWRSGAADFRRHARFDADLAYGDAPRNRLDLFHPAADCDGPLVVFIHGGYWRSFDKSMFSHMAAGAVAHGLSVAVPSYTLCPAIGIAGIIAEMRACCLYLWRRTGKPIVVAGHSAGGHLAACLAATRWDELGGPAGLIGAGLAVSGIFDLRPLLATPYNADLRLDAESARAASPLIWRVPRALRFESWVGGAESEEFIRQSRALASAWTGLGLSALYAEIPGENHFSVVNGLSDPDSQLSRALVQLAR